MSVFQTPYYENYDTYGFNPYLVNSNDYCIYVLCGNKDREEEDQT